MVHQESGHRQIDQVGSISYQWLTVGFTGHRKLADEKVVQAAIAQALDRLSMTNPRLAGATSAASGADTLFLEELSRRSIPYFLFLPASAEHFREDFTSQEWQRVSPHLSNALNIDVIAAEIPEDSGYLEAGLLVADEADVVVAVWNGRPAEGVGGTGDIVQYCRRLEKPLVVIDSQSGAIATERLEKLPTEDAKSAQAFQFGSEPAPRQLVDQLYEHLDREASRHAPSTRSLIVQLVFLHLLATAIPLISLVLKLPKEIANWASIIKLLALLCAVWLARRHHHAHHGWMNARLIAETCRSYQSIWCMRRRKASEPKGTPWQCAPLLKSLRIWWYLGSGDAAELETARQSYLKDRILHQKQYYEKAGQKSLRSLKFLRRAATTVTLGAIAAASVYLISSWLVKDDHALSLQIAKLLSLLLPLLSAALLSVVAAHDLNRRSNRYLEIVEILQRQEVRISAVTSWPGLWRIVADTESVLLHELSEWHAMTHYSGGDH